MADFNAKRKDVEYEQDQVNPDQMSEPVQESLVKQAIKDSVRSDKKHFALLLVVFAVMYLSFNRSLSVSLGCTFVFLAILVIRKIHKASTNIDTLYKHVDAITTKPPKK